MATRTTPRIFYGWWIVGGSIVLQMLSNGLYASAFGAYFVHLQAEFGWSRTVIAGAFSLARLEGGLLGPLQSWLLDRLGPRAVLRIGLLVFGLGLMFVSSIDSLPRFYVAFIVVAFGSALGGYFTVNLVLVNWFDRQRGRAMALAGTGWSIGGTTIPIVVWLISVLGWRETAFLSGIIVLAIGLPIVQIFRATPEAHGYLPDGARPATQPHSAAPPHTSVLSRRAASGRPAEPSAARPDASVASPRRTKGDGGHGPPWGLTVRQALATPAFWLLCLGHACSLLAISALNVHLIPYLASQGAMPLEAAGGVAALVTGASFAGQLVGGAFNDRFDKRFIATACMVGHGVAVLLLLGGTAPLAIAFAILHGIAWGLRGPLMMAIRAEFFGRRSFPMIEGYAGIITTVGAITGPVLAGFLADSLGDYRPAFVVLAAVALAGALAFLAAQRPHLMRHEDQPEVEVVPRGGV